MAGKIRIKFAPLTFQLQFQVKRIAVYNSNSPITSKQKAFPVRLKPRNFFKEGEKINNKQNKKFLLRCLQTSSNEALHLDEDDHELDPCHSLCQTSQALLHNGQADRDFSSGWSSSILCRRQKHALLKTRTYLFNIYRRKTRWRMLNIPHCLKK
ncbi:hypothetical protein CEXT_146781 [Caerostris extrusa]|uniref:Uncharacterized protein n=1 Tax=Caerostris extrusa TaxID=172846 RepID=A0AAV4TW86_CAEEX|nr:hypothetical protein CEXT_146781 [Caerostris extrusa]